MRIPKRAMINAIDASTSNPKFGGLVITGQQKAPCLLGARQGCIYLLHVSAPIVARVGEKSDRFPHNENQR